MASAVEQRLEPWAHELQAQVRLGLLSIDEARVVQERRRKFEYKLSTRSATVGSSSFLRYVTMELNLLCLIRARGAEALHTLRLAQRREKHQGKKQSRSTDPDKKKSKVERRVERLRKASVSFLKACVGRVSGVFTRLLQRLQGRATEQIQLEVWVSFIDVLLQLGASRELQRQLMKALTAHPRCSALWTVSASRLLNQGRISASRKVLLLALRFLPADPHLWTELLRLEASAVLRLASARFRREEAERKGEVEGDSDLTRSTATSAKLSHEDDASKAVSLKPLTLILDAATQRLAGRETSLVSYRPSDLFLIKALDVSLLLEAACQSEAPGIISETEMQSLQSHLAQRVEAAAEDQPLLALLSFKFVLLDALRREGSDAEELAREAFQREVTRALDSPVRTLLLVLFVETLLLQREKTAPREAHAALSSVQEEVAVFFDTEGEDTALEAADFETQKKLQVRDGAQLLAASEKKRKVLQTPTCDDTPKEKLSCLPDTQELHRILRKGACLHASALLEAEPALLKACLLDLHFQQRDSNAEPSLLAQEHSLRIQAAELGALVVLPCMRLFLVERLAELAGHLVEKDKKMHQQSASRYAGSPTRQTEAEAFLRKAALHAVARVIARLSRQSEASDGVTSEQEEALLKCSLRVLTNMAETVAGVTLWKDLLELRRVAAEKGLEYNAELFSKSDKVFTTLVSRLPPRSISPEEAEFIVDVLISECREASLKREALVSLLNALEIEDALPLAMQYLVKARSEVCQKGDSTLKKEATSSGSPCVQREVMLRRVLFEALELANRVASCGVRVSPAARLQALCSIGDVGLDALSKLLSEKKERAEREALLESGKKLFHLSLEAFDASGFGGRNSTSRLGSGVSKLLPSAEELRQRWNEEFVRFIRFKEHLLPERRNKCHWESSSEAFHLALKTAPDPAAFERRLRESCNRSIGNGDFCASHVCRESGRWCLDT